MSLTLPSLGFGLGLRTTHYEEIAATRSSLAWIEILTENYLVDGGRRILGSNYGSSVGATDFPRYAEMFLAGRLPIDRLIDRRIGLDDVEDAFDRLRRGEGLRSVVAF